MSHVVSQRLFSLFQDYRASPWLFVGAGGNFGDQLIYRGAEKLASRAGICFEQIPHQRFMVSSYSKRTIVYIHGGGGFTTWWSGRPIQAFRKAVTSHPGVTVLGPQTFQIDAPFLRQTIVADTDRSIASRLVVFTREAASYAALQPHLPDTVELYCDHDTALNLSPQDLKPKPLPRCGYVLYAIRTDKEAVAFKQRDPTQIWLDPVPYARSFQHWVDVHARARRIVTNRLHSAIAGMVLGIPTTLLPNSYHKNRSVWEYSLRMRGVQWADEMPSSMRWRTNRWVAWPQMERVLRSSLGQALHRVLVGVP